jgi:hypothetical protein
MGYQFFRKNVYARRGAHKWRSKERNPSLFDIRDEMIRAPHACSHVAEPREPRVLFGQSPVDAFALAAARADQAVDKRGHKLRCDTPVVAVGVASWPDTVAEIESNPQKMAEYEHWRTLTIAWLAERWGEKLQCVVEHMDEKHPHIHWVITPDLQNNGLLQIQSVHPGYEATAASKARGETKREQKQAYKAAMKALQDDYYENVASHCGLTRLGPRRQRLKGVDGRAAPGQVARERPRQPHGRSREGEGTGEAGYRRSYRQDPGGRAGPRERRHDADASPHRGVEAEGWAADLGATKGDDKAGRRTCS